MERQLIEWLATQLPKNVHVRLGIGDDAAVLAWRSAADVVVTADAVTDGVDFRLTETEPSTVGHKALGVNLSDLAAMAAEPIAAIVSLVLPRAGVAELSVLELAKQLYLGMMPLAERFGVAIAGGDTNTWDGPLAISITAIGRTTARGPLTRSGARPGDHLLVTGQLGGSILGRHLRVEPRVLEALLLHERYELHAGMDVSDGLALDASRLAAASNCGAVIDLERIPVSDDAVKLATKTRQSAVDHALGDGEDFELLLAAVPATAEAIVREQPLGVPVTRIGRCVEEPGLWRIDQFGGLAPLAATGYEH